MGAVLEGWWAGWWDICDVGRCVSDDVDVGVEAMGWKVDCRRRGSDGRCAFVVFSSRRKDGKSELLEAATLSRRKRTVQSVPAFPRALADTMQIAEMLYSLLPPLPRR